MQQEMSNPGPATPGVRYFEKKAPPPVDAAKKKAIHSEFLRTGRIDRSRPNWSNEEKRYLTYEEVAARTGRVLTAAAQRTHANINSFHKSIQFPKMVFHRTLTGTPHLGYSHVTASKTKFYEYDEVKWAFYIANFFAEINADELMFANINMRAERMYFAVAIDKKADEQKLEINKAVRGNGLLFQTQDPKIALRNVLLLGAKNETLRKIIRAL